MKFLSILIFSCLAFSLNAQKSPIIYIQGSITHSEDYKSIPYARVYNYTTKKGTKANNVGEFSLAIHSYRDSIGITALGYKRYILTLNDSQQAYMIYLDPNSNLLSGVRIKPKEDNELVDLIAKCKNNQPKTPNTGKAYYELKSYSGSQQIELVESYYNADIEGYRLKKLHLKAGRIALQRGKINKGYFTSQESSEAMLALDLFHNSEKYPLQPLSVLSSQLSKKFHLILQSISQNIEGDSIYTILFEPKDSASAYSSGSLSINASRYQIERIEFRAKNTQYHPFYANSERNQIKSVSLSCDISFLPKNGECLFHQINFSYDIDYIRHADSLSKDQFQIHTNAILYIYDDKEKFRLPFFQESPMYDLTDYSKINAFPYNDFFWRYNTEDRIDRNREENEAFFEDSLSWTSKSLFQTDYSKPNLWLLNKPFIHWSEQRVIFKEDVPDWLKRKGLFTRAQIKKIENYFNFNEVSLMDKDKFMRKLYGKWDYKPYQLYAKFFVDINSYRDSSHVLTSNILDPGENWYHAPVDNRVQCFINIYFDICETFHRKMYKELEQSPKDSLSVATIIARYNDKKQNLKSQYLDRAKMGNDPQSMNQWNRYVFEELKINNIGIFKPEQSYDAMRGY